MSQDPLRYFRIEARELIDQISAGVLDLDQQPGPDLVARLLRFAHTLKGAARVVRQPEIADRAHAFEEVLVPHRNAGEPLPAEQMRELLRLNDEIEERVAALEPQSPKPSAPLRFPPGMTPGGPSPAPTTKGPGHSAGPGTTHDDRTVTPNHSGGDSTAATRGRPRSPDTAAAGEPPSGKARATWSGRPSAEIMTPSGGPPVGEDPVTLSGQQPIGAGSTPASGQPVGSPPTIVGGQSIEETTAAATGGYERQGAVVSPGRSVDQAVPAEPAAVSGTGVQGQAGVSGGAEVSGRSGPVDAVGAGGGHDSVHERAARGAQAAVNQAAGGAQPAVNQAAGGAQPAVNQAPAGSGLGTGTAPASEKASPQVHGQDTGIRIADSGRQADGGRRADSGRQTDSGQHADSHRDADSSQQPNGSWETDNSQQTDGSWETDSDQQTDGGGGGTGVSSGSGSGQRAGSGWEADSTWEPAGARERSDAGQQHSGLPDHKGGPAPAKSEEAAKSPSHPDSAPAARGATADVDELLDAVGEAHARFAPLRTGGHALEQLTRAADALADQLRVGRTAAHTDAARVVAARLAAELGALGRRITDTVEQVERELDEVRGRAERLRLVSASSIFTALHRAVRDAADAQGKRVHFEGRGGDLRLDPQVLTLANNALLHVVRNAVAHGIEPDADRFAAGKPVEGRVIVEVERRGRYVAFRCTDDGRGFDLVAVRRTAEAKGLLMRGGTPPDEQTLVELVLRGGISTSPTVTEVAGRGIGLDVARDVADQLGGEVSVRTEAGRGAVIELVLPLALMSLHGLIVEAAGTIATVPLDAVRTCVRLLPEQATAAAVTGKMAHDGVAVPFLSLARALYAGTTVPDGGGPTVAVIVGHDGEAVAVGVDRLAGTSTLVVRPLPDLAPAAPVIGGVSMDLDGNPRLVLDAQGLVAETLRLGGGGAAPAEPVRRLPILVVDDSLTTRMLERSILESAGYEVDLAASGEEGLDMARSRRYGLYLTDIDMPGIDGFTFVSETRADPELSEVPAILVSSRASAEDRQRGAAVGASAYVVKGEFNQEELLAHIRRLVPA
jgi:two-component system chemotaxis sensor kinase CheA